MEKYGKIYSKEIALDYAIRDYELKHLDKIGYGYEIPALHDNDQYGYKDDKHVRLKKWYTDYIKSISTTNMHYFMEMR